MALRRCGQEKEYIAELITNNRIPQMVFEDEKSDVRSKKEDKGNYLKHIHIARPQL